MSQVTPKTIVVTGASSGIGKTIALKLAERKYNLVLVARNESRLRELAEKCTALGAKTHVLTADISSLEASDEIAAAALTNFGVIDAWINAAGVIFYGKFLDITPKEFRKVIEVNLFGVVYTSRAALQTFKSQNYGTLINIGSGLGAIPSPYLSPYITSKYAVRGLTASLMQEFYLDKCKDIHICSVLPSTIDTPIYQHSGNTMDRVARTIPPVYSADTAARRIIRLLDHPKTEIVIGVPVRFGTIFYSLMPPLFVRLLARYVWFFGQRAPKNSEDSMGNLYEPSNFESPTGGHQKVPK